MDDFTALLKLSEGNLTFTEAYWILKYLQEEAIIPSSRKTSTKLARLEQLLRENGIEPTELTFRDSG